jgi:hypothetical protein
MRRWRQLFANRGVLATAQAFLRRVAGSEIASELWRNTVAAPASVHPFDAHHGTDTSGLIWGEDLPTGHRHDSWNTAYYGIAPSALAEALRLLSDRASLDWACFTFIDLGSGKGRAVLVASQYPLARVLGVEIAPRLHAAALANLARFRDGTNGVGHVEFLQADAAAFPWDQPLPGPLLFFLYNPFSRPVLVKFLARLHDSLRAEPREAYLLYINPELDSVLARQGWMEKLWQQTIAIDEADQLADRFGSTTETVAAYRCR